MKKPQMPNGSIANVFNGIKETDKTISLDKAIELFINDCTLRDLRPTTIQNYTAQTEIFRRFCETKEIVTTDLNLIGADTVIEFHLYLKNVLDVQNTTINAYVTTMSVMWESMVRKGHCKHNPFKNSKLRTPKKSVGYTPTKDEIKRCINFQLKRAEGDYIQYRNLVMFVMMVDCGLRVNELANLRIEHVYVDRGYVHLHHTKNHMERKIGLSSRLTNLLNVYLPILENMGATWLFNSRGTKQISPRTAQSLVKDVGEKNALPKLSCHALRRYFASVKIHEEVPLIQLMRLLGHQSPEVTLRYYKEMDDKFLEYRDTGIE